MGAREYLERAHWGKGVGGMGVLGAFPLRRNGEIEAPFRRAPAKGAAGWRRCFPPALHL